MFIISGIFISSGRDTFYLVWFHLSLENFWFSFWGRSAGDEFSSFFYLNISLFHLEGCFSRCIIPCWQFILPVSLCLSLSLSRIFSAFSRTGSTLFWNPSPLMRSQGWFVVLFPSGMCHFSQTDFKMLSFVFSSLTGMYLDMVLFVFILFGITIPLEYKSIHKFVSSKVCFSCSTLSGLSFRDLSFSYGSTSCNDVLNY